jgi:hypothetical protein
MRFGLVRTTRTVRDENGRKAKVPALAVAITDGSGEAILRVRLSHAGVMSRYASAFSYLGADQAASALHEASRLIESGYYNAVAKAREQGLDKEFLLPNLPVAKVPKGRPTAILTVEV